MDMEAFYQQLNKIAHLSTIPRTTCLDNPLPTSQQYTIQGNNWPLLVGLARLNLGEVAVLKSELSWYPWE
jgi:hypothetical protein